MLYCTNCDTFVADDKALEGSNGLLVCPHCHSEELALTSECKICHKPIVEEDLCDDCRSIITQDITELIDVLDEEQNGQPKLDRYDLACQVAEVLEHDYL